MNAMVSKLVLCFSAIKIISFKSRVVTTLQLKIYDKLITVVLFQVRVSAVLTNAPFILNLDCDHYVNNSNAVREAMCFLMDPQLGKKLCYVQFPQRFDGIDRHDRYANRNVVFFDVSEHFVSPTLGISYSHS